LIEVTRESRYFLRLMRRRKQRFQGAGGSATREFNRQRRQNIREQWRVWLCVSAAIVGFAVWSFFAAGVAARALAAMAGLLVGVMLVLWSLGGHVSAFRWWVGAEGERDTGRLAYSGGGFRGGALRIKQALEERLGARAPWVQAVVVVWGQFPQARHEEQDVVYLLGDELRPWLSGLPEKLNAPQRAALTTALREVRASLATSR
jgi:hypothetical protein